MDFMGRGSSSVGSLRRQLGSLGDIYLDSTPPAFEAPQGTLQNLLGWINSSKGEVDNNIETREMTLHLVQSRLEVMDGANRYLSYLGIDESKGQSCHEFNTEKLFSKDVSDRPRLELLRATCELHYPPGPRDGQWSTVPDSGALLLEPYADGGGREVAEPCSSRARIARLL
jgi:hypothetical protein